MNLDHFNEYDQAYQMKLYIKLTKDVYDISKT